MDAILLCHLILLYTVVNAGACHIQHVSQLVSHLRQRRAALAPLSITLL